MVAAWTADVEVVVDGSTIDVAEVTGDVGGHEVAGMRVFAVDDVRFRPCAEGSERARPWAAHRVVRRAP